MKRTKVLTRPCSYSKTVQAEIFVGALEEVCPPFEVSGEESRRHGILEQVVLMDPGTVRHKVVDVRVTALEETKKISARLRYLLALWKTFEVGEQEIRKPLQTKFYT